MNSSLLLYHECCKQYNVKPNICVEDQLSLFDLLHLRRIDVRGTYLGSHGVRAVLAFVRQHRCITDLLLGQNGMDEDAVRHLIDVIEEGHPSLSHLDLSGNVFSTPTVRQLWKALQDTSKIQSVQLEGCEVPEEWAQRIEGTLKRNRAMEGDGFYLYGVPRSLHSWYTVFILVLGQGPAVQMYCDRVLPLVGRQMARLRVRVAPITLDPSDQPQQIQAKTSRCRCSLNYSMTWCVSLFGRESLSRVQLHALEGVLQETAPMVPPLFTKSGEQRPAVRRCATASFLYTQPDWDGAAEEVTTLSASRWLRMAGYGNTSTFESLQRRTTRVTSVLTSTSFDVRCSTDLLTSLECVFDQDPAISSPTSAAMESASGSDDILTLSDGTADERTCVERGAAIGVLHPRKSGLVLGYTRQDRSDSSMPFIIYGASCIGKSFILCNVATLLRESGEGGRVVCHVVDPMHPSLVVLLCRLLRLFSPDTSPEYGSVAALADAVMKAIQSYAGPPLTLLIAQLDLLDSCGEHDSLVAAWLPHVLPAPVRIVLSLDTGSAVLPLLRQRTPQPYECLCPPMTEVNCVQAFRRCLVDRGVALPGMEERATKSRESLSAAEKAYMAKEDAVTVLYAALAASYIQQLQYSEEHCVESDYETADMMEGSLPSTNGELVELLCQMASVIHNRQTVEWVLVLACMAPLPAAELTIICEELGQCTPRSTVPALLHLTDMGLVDWYEDGTAHVPDPSLRKLLLQICSHHVGHLSVLLEEHLHHLVVSRSKEVPHALRFAIPLMIENGSTRRAVNLAEDASVVDAALSDPQGRFYVFDALLRLTTYYYTLYELAAAGGPPMPVELSLTRLLACLQDVGRCQSDLQQTALLHKSFSPYAQLPTRERGGLPRSTVLVGPTNDGAEDTSKWQLGGEDGVCIHLDARGDYMVTSTKECVTVYTVSDVQTRKPERVARLHMPFEKHHPVQGALLATGTRAIVVGKEQLLIWDFESGAHFVFEGITTPLRHSSLDPFASLVLARRTGADVQSGEESVIVIDALKKRIARVVPTREGETVQEARFCGSQVVLVCGCAVHLLGKESQVEVTLMHDYIVHHLDCSSDGRILVTGLKTQVVVWSSRGEVLHDLDLGLLPITALQLSPSGAEFAVQCWNATYLFRTLTGGEVATVANPLSATSALDYFFFAESHHLLAGRVGPYALLWDASKGQALGAYAAPRGCIVYIWHHNGVVYAATTTGEVLVWPSEAKLLSVPSVVQGTVTSNWLRNAKLSSLPLRRGVVNQGGTLLLTVDSGGYALVHSMVTGVPIPHDMRRVRSATLLDADTVAFLPLRGEHLCIYQLSDGSHEEHPLPRDLVDGAAQAVRVSGDEKYLAVLCTVQGHSKALMYSTEKGTPFLFSALGHTGSILCLHFFGAFAFTVGEEDGCVRLWSMARTAERASYTHPNRILCAAAGNNGVLYFIDSSRSLFQIHVDNILSSTRASFVVEEVKEAMIAEGDVPRELHVSQGRYLVVVYGDGSLGILDVYPDSVQRRVRYNDCVSACVFESNGSPLLLSLHASGKGIRHSVMTSSHTKQKGGG